MRVRVFIGLMFLLSVVYISCDKSEDSGTNPSGWIVNFPDTNLALAIRENLDKPSGEISREELLTITSFTAINRGIKFLDGMGYISNLEYLDLAYNDIIDIEDLASLTKLKNLILDNNKIIKIDSLRRMTELTQLRLLGNGISVINALEFLPNLSDAVLSHNYIGDLSPIVNNSNYGIGDTFDFTYNPLGVISVNVYIPALRDRGVIINY